MKKWEKLANDKTLQEVKSALESNNFQVEIVETGKAAKEKVLSIIPKGANVMNMTSITLETIGVTAEIMESGKYEAVKKKLAGMDRQTQHREMQVMGSAPEWAVGSVHAVTEDGTLLIASNTGSQLAGYVYGSDHVVFVVGSQKIVKNIEEGMNRVYEHSLPHETVRARKAYGMPESWNSFVSKLLIYKREPRKGRVTVILVKEKLGF